jgi:hypothetical protein
MYAAYHLNADELNADTLQILKNAFQNQKIVILPQETYEKWEKARRNTEFTEELQTRIRELDEGKGIVKTIADLEALENE